MNFGRAVWPLRIHSVIRCLRQNVSGFAATAHPMPSIGMYSQTGSQNISSTPMPDQLAVLPPPWDKFLREVDAQLPERVHLVCIGGFVLAVLYGFPRPTDDLDYLSIYPKHASEIIEKIAGKLRTSPTIQSLHPFCWRCCGSPGGIRRSVAAHPAVLRTATNSSTRPLRSCVVEAAKEQPERSRGREACCHKEPTLIRDPYGTVRERNGLDCER